MQTILLTYDCNTDQYKWWVNGLNHVTDHVPIVGDILLLSYDDPITKVLYQQDFVVTKRSWGYEFGEITEAILNVTPVDDPLNEV